MLAQITIKPSERTYDGISEDLLRLLQLARHTAIQQGVIPVEVNPSTNEAPLGDVTFSTLYHIVDQVRSMPEGTPVTVTAKAAVDTWSIDQLNLSFKVGGDQVGRASASVDPQPSRIVSPALRGRS